jgi:hypothetical protein
MEAWTKQPHPENYRFGKRLDAEIYVASEASATPVASYAPLSNFSGRSRVSLPWTPGTEMLSSLDFPLPATPARRPFATRRIATKQLISGGFST